MNTLKEMAKDARNLASTLFATNAIPCTQPTLCLQGEEDRPLTKEEKGRGWARRPFWAYSPSRMCDACAAYWHAERAAQILHDLDCLHRRMEARQAVAAE